jgi:hypothetical protein
MFWLVREQKADGFEGSMKAQASQISFVAEIKKLFHGVKLNWEARHTGVKCQSDSKHMLAYG